MPKTTRKPRPIIKESFVKEYIIREWKEPKIDESHKIYQRVDEIMNWQTGDGQLADR